MDTICRPNKNIIITLFYAIVGFTLISNLGGCKTVEVTTPIKQEPTRSPTPTASDVPNNTSTPTIVVDFHPTKEAPTQVITQSASPQNWNGRVNEELPPGLYMVYSEYSTYSGVLARQISEEKTYQLMPDVAEIVSPDADFIELLDSGPSIVVSLYKKEIIFDGAPTCYNYSTSNQKEILVTLCHPHDILGNWIKVINVKNKEEVDLEISDSNIDAPIISPNGQWIAFYNRPSDMTPRGESEANDGLYLYNTNCLEPESGCQPEIKGPYNDQLWTQGPSSWSPDSQKIAILSTDQVSIKIFDLATEGFATILLTDGEGMPNSISWSPDGRYIAYGRGDNNNTNIYILQVDNGEITKFLESPYAQVEFWLAVGNTSSGDG